MDSNEIVEPNENGDEDSNENCVSETDKVSEGGAKEYSLPSGSNTFSSESVQRNPWSEVKCVFCEKFLSSRDCPKLLDCLHSSCKSCIITKLKELEDGQDDVVVKSLECPLCDLSFPAVEVIDNQFLVQASYEQEDGHKPKDVICTSCAEGNPATSWCVNCSEFICDACVEAHHRLKITKDHTIQAKDVAKVERDSQASSNSSQTVNCPIHRQEKLTLFCETCDRLTCRDCQLTSHRDHKYKFINEIANETRGVIKGLLGEVCYKRILLSSAIKVIDERQEVIKHRKAAVVAEITDMVVKLTTALNKRGKVLVQCLSEMCETKQDTLSQKRAALKKLSMLADHCIQFVEGAIKHGTDTALLFSKKSLGSHLQRIKSYKADIPNPEMPVRINFMVEGVAELERVLSSLGKISVDGRPPFSVGPSLPSPNSPLNTTAAGLYQAIPLKMEVSPPPLHPIQNYRSPSPNSQHLPVHQSVITQVSQVQPHASQVQPHVSQVQPHVSQVLPHVSQIQSHVSQVQPHVSQVQPHVSQIQPHVSHMPPTQPMRLSYPQTITTIANPPQGNSPQLSSSHSSSNIHQIVPGPMPGVHRQIPATLSSTYQVIPTQPLQVNTNCPTNVPRVPHLYNHQYTQQVQQRLLYQQQQMQAQQYARQRPVTITTAAGTIFPVRGPTLLTQQQVTSSTHPGHSADISDLNLKGLLSQNITNAASQHMHPRVIPQNPSLTTVATNAQIVKPSLTLHHRYRSLPGQQVITQDNNLHMYRQPPPYPNPPPLIPVNTVTRASSLSPSFRTPTTATVQLSWHIPQHGNISQEASSLSAGASKKNTEMTDGLPFKITLKAPSNSQAAGPSSARDSIKPHQVSSSDPESTHNKGLTKRDDARSLDEFCQESVKDLMATIACLDESNNPTQTRNSNGRGSSQSEVELGSASTSEASRTGVVSASMEQQVHVDSSTGSPLAKPIVHSKKRRKVHKEKHLQNNNADGEGVDGRSPMRDDPNEDWCAVCMDGGELVCCDKCPKVYHIYCHIPGLKAIPGPSEAWQCLLCTGLDEILSTPLGSRQGNSSRGLCLRDLQLARRILLELYCQYEPSLAFRELPGPECEGYLETIRRPMSLDIIRSKLDPDHVKHYKDLGEFVDDIRLVFSNAYTFNPEESQVFADARALEEFFNQLLWKWLPIYMDEEEVDPLGDEDDEDDEDELLFGSPPRRRRRSK